jgi:hypothetical protein
MKKRLGLVVCAAAVVGAVAVPAGNAFGNAAARQAIRCAALQSQDQSYDNAITASTNPITTAILQAFEDHIDAKGTAQGCAWATTD